MAKKKTRDTKGLAGVIEYGMSAASGKDIRLNKKVKPANQGGGPNYLGKVETVTVPKQWLSSPDHVVAELAYITPAEQKILLEANLYGSLNGIPNRGPGGLMSLQGDMGSVGGGSSSGSSGGSSSGGNDNSDDDRDDIESEAYTSAMLEEAGYTPQGTLAGEGETASGRMSRLGLTPEQYSLIQRGLAIKDLDPSSKEGFTLSQIENLNKRIGRTTDIFGINQKIKDAILSQQGRNVYTDKAGNIVGVTHEPTDKFGSTLANILNAIGLKPGVSPDNLYNEQLVYTGASQFDPFGVGGGRDDGGDDRKTKTEDVVVSVTDEIKTPEDYYSKGVGTATKYNLYDPTQIDPYLASLYGITPSPIGATYDAASRSYSIPSKKSKKQRRRLRGLDIFKPVSS